MRLVGILGGTFNPIHFGHLRMAQDIAEAVQLSEVRFVPSANPPHKEPPKVSADNRARMVQIAIADNLLFKLDTRELDRTGNSYTIDTLTALKSEMSAHEDDDALCLLMGSDAFIKFDTWHRWQEILNYCHIILVQRPVQTTNQPPLSEELTQLLQQHYTENSQDLSSKHNGYIHMQAVTALNISSTAIRSRLARNQIPHYLTPKMVVDFIVANQLYG